MKTEGLSFLEAVQAMRDGRCGGIRRDGWTGEFRGSRFLSYCRDGKMQDMSGFELDSFLAADWLLVSPVVPTEEREVKRWTNVYPNEVELTYINVEAAERHARPDRIACVELTGTYRAPVKEKVRKSVSWKTSFAGDGCDMRLNNRPEVVHGKSGTLTFEYEE